ncbi:hypothetical protein CSW08_06135 [Confluentibacter flavum]|uniref:Uncharacterized protein n=1 Tax=Confluentibacter flavum TaxID=1909700 RepID=A0A2N3HKZ7_9FLAO|nr:hypothetical protein CSW08_06135 [Confluentibacter flavum]
MLKLNCLLLTVTISFFSLFLFKTESTISFQAITHTHDIKIDGLYNAFAISANNSFHELLNFDKQKLTNANFIYTFTCLKKMFLDEHFNYLKLCNLIDLNLTTHTIIFPFHSFL